MKDKNFRLQIYTHSDGDIHYMPQVRKKRFILKDLWLNLTASIDNNDNVYGVVSASSTSSIAWIKKHIALRVIHAYKKDLAKDNNIKYSYDYDL